ncbi:hypothetical protein QFZ81_003846 [Paenibacillus sp. V4I9]|uniref:DUF3139 domain-containing protein n=1 Tax=Paenibacillus sp. V4I9 TaxID=3042308 RepID=UPI0027814F27|nr:DUF3139 domain-containing protein [Paenibacillus sp. V4I9]MDQ0888758.1 hypothetical protein [Paenibacillus sp. V4I9]
MSKVKKIIIISVWVFSLGLIATPFLYVAINKMLYDYRVTNYLIEEKGYRTEEIKSVKGVWGIKLPPFYAVVVFKDEPFVEYVYFAHRPNHILQFSYRITDVEQQKAKSDLKHLVPIE